MICLLRYHYEVNWSSSDPSDHIFRRLATAGLSHVPAIPPRCSYCSVRIIHNGCHSRGNQVLRTRQDRDATVTSYQINNSTKHYDLIKSNYYSVLIMTQRNSSKEKAHRWSTPTRSRAKDGHDLKRSRFGLPRCLRPRPHLATSVVGAQRCILEAALSHQRCQCLRIPPKRPIGGSGDARAAKAPEHGVEMRFPSPSASYRCTLTSSTASSFHSRRRSSTPTLVLTRATTLR